MNKDDVALIATTKTRDEFITSITDKTFDDYSNFENHAVLEAVEDIKDAIKYPLIDQMQTKNSKIENLLFSSFKKVK
jgi:hypothetical protein